MSDHSHPAAFEAPEIEEVARLFPNYHIIRLLACGGMGAVYEATQTSLDRQVAIKILPREFSSDQAFREGFEAEAKAMAKLNHPNLISVYDFGEADGMLYIIMEYVDGNSLFASSNGLSLDPAVAISIIGAVCRGLANAHENGILHRDIKPSNILLDKNANPKIGDFGLARALEREIQEGEQIFGTPGYTAPEVLEPPFTIDQRADIYSVGVMLHELLTGQLPDADPRSASQISGCSFRLDPVIRKATHRQPSQRYSSCTELAETLAKIPPVKSTPMLTATSSAGSAGPAALRPQRKIAPVKSSSSSSGLGIILFLLAIGAAITLFVLNQKGTETTDSPTPPESPTTVTAIPTSPPTTETTTPQNTGFNPTAILEKITRDVTRDLEQAQQTAQQTRRQNNAEYEKNLRQLATKLSAEERTPALDAITAHLTTIASNNDEIPQEIPEKIATIPDAPPLHDSHLKAQQLTLTTVSQKIREAQSYYALELEHAIATNKNTAPPEALATLQSELTRVETDPHHFKTQVLNLPSDTSPENGQE